MVLAMFTIYLKIFCRYHLKLFLIIGLIIIFVKSIYSELISLFMFFLFLSPVLSDLFFEFKKFNYYLIYPVNLRKIVLYKNLTIISILLLLFTLSDILFFLFETSHLNMKEHYFLFIQSLIIYLSFIQYAYLLNKNNNIKFLQLFVPPLSAFVPLTFSYITVYYFNTTANVLIFLLVVIGWYFLFIPHFSKSLHRGNFKCIP